MLPPLPPLGRRGAVQAGVFAVGLYIFADKMQDVISNQDLPTGYTVSTLYRCAWGVGGAQLPAEGEGEKYAHPQGRWTGNLHWENY